MRVLKHKLLWLIVLSASVRCIFATVYPIKRFPDTTDYFLTARQLATADQAEREKITEAIQWPKPSGYPYIIAASGFDPRKVVFIQSLMGIGTAALLYLIFASISGSNWLGFLIGLSHGLNPSQLLFEFALVSETSGTFFLTVSVLLLFLFFSGNTLAGWSHFLLLGLASGLTVLMRSQLQVLLALVTLYLVYYLFVNLRRGRPRIAAYLVPVILLLFSSGFTSGNIFKMGVTPTHGVMLFYNMVPLIEYAPDKYRDFKEVLIHHREEYRKSGRPLLAFSLSTAFQELRRTSGMNPAEISDRLGEMALSIIRQKPLWYLKTVLRATAEFFKPTWYSRQLGIRTVLRGGKLSSKIIAAPYAVFHLACMGTFILYPMLWLLIPFLRARNYITFEVAFIYILVLAVALSQAVFSFGDPRYKTSVEPLILGTAIFIAYRFIRDMRATGRRAGPTELTTQVIK